jgi:hypothetical protein
MLLSCVYVMKFEVFNTPDIPQTSLHKHETITQITPEIPQASLHKHGTITNITPEIPQTALHKHGKITSITPDICQQCFVLFFPCLCNEV